MAFDFTNARSLQTIIPDTDPVPLVRPETSGMESRLIVRFGVGGHPAQWVTHGTSGSKSYQRECMRQWKYKVATAALIAMRHVAGRGPKGGWRKHDVTLDLVEVWMDFVFLPSRMVPDRTNLAKSTEDALQGIVFANDVQVIGGNVRRFIGEYEGVVIEVFRSPRLMIP